MNSAIVVAFAAVLAVANAGYLGAPAVGLAYSSPLNYHNAYAVSSSTGIVRGAPLVAAYPAHHGLVRVARGAVYGAAPLAYAARPAVYASPALISRSYHGNTSPVVYGGLPHIRVARGILGASPVAYAAGPAVYAAHPAVYAAPAVKTVAYAAPAVYAAPALRTVAYAAPAVKTVAYSAGPVAYAAHPAVYGAPLTYAAGPVAYAAPVKVVHAAPVLL